MGIHEKTMYYLNHEDERLQIADEGYERVKELNTNLDNFAKQIVKVSRLVKQPTQ